MTGQTGKSKWNNKRVCSFISHATIISKNQLFFIFPHFYFALSLTATKLTHFRKGISSVPEWYKLLRIGFSVMKKTNDIDGCVPLWAKLVTCRGGGRESKDERRGRWLRGEKIETSATEGVKLWCEEFSARSGGWGVDGRCGAHDCCPNREGEAVAADSGEQFGHCGEWASQIQGHVWLHSPYGQGRRHSLFVARQWQQCYSLLSFSGPQFLSQG